MPVISGSLTKSGITNHSPRVIIREKDNSPGDYPSRLSSADYDRRGKTYKPFDGRYVINYLTASSPEADMKVVQHPVKLLQNQLSLFGPFSVSPNTNSNIFTTGSIIRGASDNNLNVGHAIGYHEPSFSGPGNIKTYKWVPTTNHWINEEEPIPFADDRIKINDSTFYKTGTVGIYQNMSEPLGSKVSFKINISSKEERILTRASKARLDQSDPQGEFLGQDVTGFCYYNFNTKKWDQIGLRDPATGNPIHFDWAVETRGGPSINTAIQINLHSGTNNWPQQFKSSPNTSPEAGSSAKLAKGYNRIGTPTVTCLAPFSTKYHATSSQALAMSNYIDHPFVLEKVVIDLPIQTQRKHRFLDKEGRKTMSDMRDQDDYVFFIYRQSRRLSGAEGKDSAYDVSGSNRFLICSGVMTFYNNTVRSNTGLNTYSFSPTNNSAFSHDFKMEVPTDSNYFAVEYTGSFTGSVSLNVQPAVAASQYTGIMTVQESRGDPGGAGRIPDFSKGYSKIKNYWPGGTSADPFLQESRSVDSSPSVLTLCSSRIRLVLCLWCS